MSVEQMRAICDEAHQYGVIVGAHAQSRKACGVRCWPASIPSNTAACSRRIDRHVPAQSECVARILGIDSDTVRRPAIDLAWTGRDRHHRHPIGEFQKRGRRHGFRCSSGARGRIDDRRRHRYRHDIRAAVATWRELELLVAYAGFSPAEALHAATAVNASILGADAETGSLEVGKSADLLVLNANPLDDLRALEHPALVIAAGHPVWRPGPKRFADIDALLDEAYA